MVAFVTNLEKNQLVEWEIKSLVHHWISGKYQEPVTTNVEALDTNPGKVLAKINRPTLCGLFSFHHEYILAPPFAEVMQPIRQLLA